MVAGIFWAYMTKGEETRQAIIEKAAPLFNQRGFLGCSMSDIMEATGLQKGGIYRHFSSKEHLAEAVFRYSAEASMKLRLGALDAAADPLAALRELIQRFVHAPSAVPGGCPLLNTAVDADDGNEALRSLVRRSFQHWRNRIVRIAEMAAEAGQLEADTDVRWLADAVISTLEGAAMLSRLERSRDPLLHAERTLHLMLNVLSEKAALGHAVALEAPAAAGTH